MLNVAIVIRSAHQPFVDGLRTVADVRPHIADSRYALPHVAKCECSWLHFTTLNFVPGAGSRHGRIWLCTNCIGSGKGCTVAITACIDQNASTPIGLTEFLRQLFWIAAHQKLA